MNNIEETLWNYIDGNCTTDEHKAISQLIAQDEASRLKYQELLKLNKEFAAMELEEPPMAFTYNVIEAIRTEQAQQPLKAAVNKRIIMFIAGFFILTILAFLMYMMANTTWSAGKVSLQVPEGLKLPATENIFSKPVVQGFFFFDIVLALFFFDSFIRRKRASSKQV